jgi:hypothetical protein
MTTNTSATGGYLVPASVPDPKQDQTFEDFVQQVFVGILGIDKKLVRPRFQLEDINLPAVGTDWVAFGATNYKPDTFAVEDANVSQYVDTGYWQLGYAVADSPSDFAFQRNEEVTFLVSFFGPNDAKNMALLRDGLQVSQNRTILLENKITLVEATNSTRVPALVKDRWLDKIDLEVIVRRLILRSYPILTLRSATGTLYNEIDSVSINVNE